MISLLHSFYPQPIIYSFGLISLRWYGLIMSLALLVAITCTLYINKRYFKFNKDKVFDLAFWLIIFGLVGARLYDVLLQLPFYLQYPEQIIQIWKGGLAIHGGIIGGAIYLFFFSKKNKLDFIELAALLTPGLALGQAIGRWGNYFNQELFGKPTSLPWGIPIAAENRPDAFLNQTYFHPTFLYESLGCLLIFFLLLFFLRFIKTKRSSIKKQNFWLVIIYVISYSLLRFLLEFIRIDDTPTIGWLRWPQIISLLAIIGSILIIIIYDKNAVTKKI